MIFISPLKCKLITADILDKKHFNYKDFVIEIEKDDNLIEGPKCDFKFTLMDLDQKRQKVEFLVNHSCQFLVNLDSHLIKRKIKKQLSENRIIEGYKVLYPKQQKLLWISKYDFEYLKNNFQVLTKEIILDQSIV